MDGKDRQSDERTLGDSAAVALLLVAFSLLAAGTPAHAQALYKYQAQDGSWIFSDRPPPGEQQAEIRELPTGTRAPDVSVTTTVENDELLFIADNRFHAPVEVILALDALHDVELPPSDIDMRWVIPPQTRQTILGLPASEDALFPAADFRFIWIPGDPASEHRPSEPYRAPFAVANEYPITQAFPMGNTHNTPDSRHAVDLAMPVGTDIYAARSGIVFEVASTNFRGGVDAEAYAAPANIVRILHDDGTHAVYAHLNWNTIRVRPGDRVERGEYIADSGNTGFSSGPHLHFVVLQNKGMRLESVPVVFEGPNLSEIAPAAGNILAAY